MPIPRCERSLNLCFAPIVVNLFRRTLNTIVFSRPTGAGNGPGLRGQMLDLLLDHEAYEVREGRHNESRDGISREGLENEGDETDFPPPQCRVPWQFNGVSQFCRRISTLGTVTAFPRMSTSECTRTRLHGAWQRENP